MRRNKFVKEEAGEYYKIMGGRVPVQDFAAFWKYNADFMQLVAQHKLLEWIEKNNFDPSHLAVFKEGLAVFPAVFEGCFQEFSRGDNTHSIEL